MTPGYLLEASGSAANERYSTSARPRSMAVVASSTCRTCGGPLEAGFVSTTNGSGLFWAHESASRRLRPNGLEVLVPTGYQGTYSANLAGERCASCKTILVKLP